MNPLYSIRNVRLIRSQGPGYTLVLPELDIQAGEKIVLTGPSGCGKSTALDLLGMVLRPSSAERFVFHPEEEMAICNLWEARGGQDSLANVRLKHMGYVLQTGGLLPFLNVYENMALTVRLLRLPDARERVEALAQRLGIARLLTAMPERLSIGERQRVAIGRALASHPRVLLADEPTAALDPLHARVVLELLLSAVDETGSTLVLATHDTSVLRLGGFRHFQTRLVSREDDPDVVEAFLEEVASHAVERGCSCTV